MDSYRVEGDVLAWAGMRVVLQRIALSHWRPRTALRSWGLVPLHLIDACLHAPCADDETIWLGLWTEPRSVSARAQVIDAVTGAQGAVERPGESALGTLGATQPLSRLGSAWRTFELHMQRGSDQAMIELRLQAPVAWSAISGRPPPAPLRDAPALPPRLG